MRATAFSSPFFGGPADPLRAARPGVFSSPFFDEEAGALRTERADLSSAFFSRARAAAEGGAGAGFVDGFEVAAGGAGADADEPPAFAASFAAGVVADAEHPRCLCACAGVRFAVDSPFVALPPLTLDDAPLSPLVAGGTFVGARSLFSPTASADAFGASLADGAAAFFTPLSARASLPARAGRACAVGCVVGGGGGGGPRASCAPR